MRFITTLIKNYKIQQREKAKKLESSVKDSTRGISPLSPSNVNIPNDPNKGNKRFGDILKE